MKKKGVSQEDRRLWVRLQRNDPSRYKSLFDSIQFLGEHGFHAQTIADVCGITKNEVYIACAKLKIRLRDYRDGRNWIAKKIIVQTPKIIVSKESAHG